MRTAVVNGCGEETLSFWLEELERLRHKESRGRRTAERSVVLRG